ncbi:MAG: chemotaxis protein CheW, partial [Acidaminobacteraceae bacterium]
MDKRNEVIDITEDTQRGKYLTFSIGKENYGLEIKYVIDIIGIQSITEIPDQPYYIKGVINLRGKIIPTMDIRMRFNKDYREYDDRTCIIVVEISDLSVGIIVDRVLEVIEIENENISLAPKFNGDFQ